ncbi:MAG: mechanosensitive ion channel [Planctomycetes bacterium]|nr:mechanosensitive ion channel [Planctomycetota bacterium]
MTVREFLATNGLQLLINVTMAAIIFFVGRWIAKILSDLIEKALHHARMDATLGKFIRNLTYFAMLAFVAIAALSRLGVQTTSAVAAIGAAGLAVGLALQGSLSNFAAGVLLIIFKPFKVGDFVETAGAKGTVQEIQIFNTVLHSPDNVRIVIPNAQVTGSNIINYTANDKRRVDLVIGVSYGDDLSKVKQVILSVLLADSRVLRSPEPAVAVSALAESSVNLVVRPWVKSEDYWPVYFDLTEKIKVELEANGITIPFPQRDIHIRTGQQKV